MAKISQPSPNEQQIGITTVKDMVPQSVYNGHIRHLSTPKSAKSFAPQLIFRPKALLLIHLSTTSIGPST